MRPTFPLLRPPPPFLSLPTVTKPQIYISHSLSPHLNLAYEDYLFRHADVRAPVLLLYRNRRCVVIGRNQNPWLETSPSHLLTTGTPLLRRRSGGGAVFHDPLNTNYSLHLPRSLFNRSQNADLVCSALHRLGEPRARRNERNDIYVGPYKVSGSAYKIRQERAYHHGTMLLGTRTEGGELGRWLSSRIGRGVVSRGVESVRAEVRSLRELGGMDLPGEFGGAAPWPAEKGVGEAEGEREGERYTHEAFVGVMREVWEERWGDAEEYEVGEEEMLELREVREGVRELESWVWVFGQTPYFEVWGWLGEGSEKQVLYKVYHGVVTGVDFASSYQPTVQERQLAEKMVEQQCRFEESWAIMDPAS